MTWLEAVGLSPFAELEVLDLDAGRQGFSGRRGERGGGGQEGDGKKGGNVCRVCQPSFRAGFVPLRGFQRFCGQYQLGTPFRPPPTPCL
jgi:hypothetical protein